MTIYEYGNPDADTVLIQLTGDHELSVLKNEVEEIRKRTSTDFRLIAAKVDDWNYELSPWKAPAVFGNEVEIASVYYSNSGNLIVPIVTFILGQDWVLYGCVFMSVQLIFLWTHCKKIISRESSYDWKKIVLNINMISIFIGVVLFFAKIHLPEIINNTLGSVGSMIGPASMIVTGMLFAGMNLKQIFADKRVYFVSFLRLIAVPLLALVMIKISHLAMFSADGNKIILIVFLAIITPSASTITQMCQVYGNDSRYASAINVMTTLFSIITMPLMVMLFEAVI